MAYYFSKVLDEPFDRVLSRVVGELKKEGFGVLTEIDVRQTLKNKLGVDFRSYKILGACNPPFAHRALLAENKIGLLLPCNVVVQELPESGKVEVSAVDPVGMMAAVGNPALEELAREVASKLKKAIDSL